MHTSKGSRKYSHRRETGAPNDVFLLNALKTLFRLSEITFRSLEMHSKRRCKIHVCAVVLGQLESFQNYKGFGIILQKILNAILS